MKLKRIWLFVFLGLLAFLVIFQNFKIHTWLIGWDNLHPEFNIFLNIKRSLFAVWQEYQGLGLLGGMGHAADLPRQVFLLIATIFLPTDYLRYLSTFLMLFIGPIGVYFLLSALFPKSVSKKNKKSACFLGSLFYLLNLATVQMFFVPFEAFVFHFGFLPWLLFFAINYLSTKDKKTLILFFIISIISTTQSYVPTLFVVYLFALLALLIGIFLKKRNIRTIKDSFVILLVTFIANAFWLLPFAYFTLTSSSVVAKAYENFMATEDIYLRNKEFGDLTNVALLRGFWFKFVDMDIKGDFYYMIGAWRNHLTKASTLSIGYFTFIIVLAGLLYQFIKKHKYSYSLVFLFLIPFFMLANDTIPFSLLTSFLRENIPLFRQVFRVPFTKYAVLAALSYSILFSFGSLWLIDLFGKIAKKTKLILVGILSFLLIWFSYPVFNGNLLYSYARLKIPKEYYQAFEFFQSQDPNTRIANFPQYTYWGWNHHRWGYRGSGFLWYGINQPVLDRAFDGYNQASENYYWQVSKAIYSENLELFENILEKYQINWLLLDESVIPLSSYKVLNLDQFEKVLQKSAKIHLEQEFGYLKIYKVNLNSKYKNFISLASNLVQVEPNYSWNNYDRAYEEYGTYTSDSQQQVTNDKYSTTIYYPFRSLFTGRMQEELEFELEDKGEYFNFQTQIPTSLVGGELVLPVLGEEEVVEINKNDLSIILNKYPKLYLDTETIQIPPPSTESEMFLDEVQDETVSFEKSIPLSYINHGLFEIKVPKISGYYSYDVSASSEGKQPKNCDQFNKGSYTHDEIEEGNKKWLRLTSVGSSNCLDFDLPDLAHNLGYLVSIESRNVEGKSLLFAIINKNSQRADLETYLPKSNVKNQISNIDTSYFIIPPMEEDGRGYSLHFDNVSIGRVKTINDLGRIAVNPIPYRFLTGLKIIKKNQQLNHQPSTISHQSFDVQHSNPSYYQVQLSQSFTLNPATYLLLSQSYDKGWKAYEISCQSSKFSCQLKKWFPFVLGKEKKDHLLVNNWQNGWRIRGHNSDFSNQSNQNLPTTNNQQPTTIIVVYLPQYLQYLGFGLLLFVPVLILLNKSKKRPVN